MKGENLKCCGNCLNYTKREGKLECDEKVGLPNTQPWNVCDSWEWDDWQKSLREQDIEAESFHHYHE